MGLPRYDIIDAYTLEELRREYSVSDANGRIRLLQRLHKGGRIPPFQIALSAVEDPRVEVRQWMARLGYLDYSEQEEEEEEERPPDYEASRPNLAARLKRDPDPFVRACLRENPTVFGIGEDWIECFREATHLERLALVRNPEVDDELMRKVFDCEDRELGISLEERGALVRAFLTNQQALSRSKSIDVRHAFDQVMGAETLGALDWVMTSGHFSQLWTLISKWPERTGNLQYAVYRYVNAPDDTKAEVYRVCAEPVWRQAILENCDPDDLQTIELGMKDPDDGCRELAYRSLTPAIIWRE